MKLKFPIFILLVGLLVTWMSYYMSHEQIRKMGLAQFERQSQKVRQSIEERLGKNEALVRGAQALFESQREITKEEWRKYVDALHIEHHYPGLVGLGYMPYVTAAEKSQFIAHARATVDPQFEIWPASVHENYFPLLFVEPLAKNHKAVGFDAGTNSNRRLAAERARDLREGSITGKVELASENVKGPAFLIYFPIYKMVGEKSVFKGWVSGAFLMENLMSGVQSGAEASIDAEIYDGSALSHENILYDGDGVAHALDPQDHSIFAQTIPITLGGRTWTLHMTTGPVFSEIMDQTRPIIILVGGILASFLLSGLFYSILATQQHAKALAKTMTHKLAESLALNEAILNGANYSIISTDLNGTILTFNSAAERMLGYSAGDIVGKVTPAIIHDAGEVITHAQELSEELGHPVPPGFDVFVAKAKLGIVEERQWTYIRKDGSRFPVLLSVTPIRNADGEITRFMGIASDMTEQHKINQMKNEFISTVSHELRTPMTSIKGALGLIAGGGAGPLPEKARPLLQVALANCDRLVRLINNILDVEKIESGKIEFQMGPVDMSSLIQQVVSANAAYAQEFGVSLELEDQLLKDGKIVRGDMDRLNQVMTNLISNAVKFSPKNEKVLLRASTVDGKVHVQVSDHGSGIPTEFKDRIFQKFAQADASSNRKTGGTGLGLSISKAIIEKMGGTIGFNSNPRGTEFHFDLDVSQGKVT